MSSKKSAVRELCEFLQCDVRSLKNKLENPDIRPRVDRFLTDHNLYVTYKIRNEPIIYKGLSTDTARYLYAYNGFKGTNVDQHFYSTYRINLRYPWLPCVMEPRGNDEYSYYPLELLRVAPKNKEPKHDLFFQDTNYNFARPLPSIGF